MTTLLALGLALVVVIGAIAFVAVVMWLASKGHDWIVAVFIVLILVAMMAMLLYPLAGKLLGTTG